VLSGPRRSENVQGEWKELYSYSLYIMAVKSRGIIVACMEETRNAYKILVPEPQWKC
jgi:hypothetical protein